MEKKIKVLECIRQGQIGGGESHLLSLVENLDRNVFDPVVLSFTDGPMIDRLQQMGVQTHIIPTEKPFDVGKWGAVKRLLVQESADIVHAHGTRACSNVLRPARSLNIPLVYTVHGWSFHPDQNPLVRRVRVLGEKYLTSKAAVNISVSASNKETGVQHIRDFRSEVISNGIDRKRFSSEGRSPAGVFGDIRAELGIPQDAVLVLFIARFTSHKQPLTLMRAFRACLTVLPDMRLLLVGDGDQKTEGLRLAKEWGLESRIGFLPFRNDVPDILAAADIFVLPSLWEGLPIGLLEAMAMGKAVIATDVDGTREVVQDGRNGLLIPAGDIPALTAALIGLGGNEAKRNKLRAAARETVREQYDAEQMTRKIERVYCDVLAGK
jgi:glycosyltransferase involved in cell wall biosynthesis